MWRRGFSPASSALCSVLVRTDDIFADGDRIVRETVLVKAWRVLIALTAVVWLVALDSALLLVLILLVLHHASYCRA
jgi:hypothetical protein